MSWLDDVPTLEDLTLAADDKENLADLIEQTATTNDQFRDIEQLRHDARHLREEARTHVYAGGVSQTHPTTSSPEEVEALRSRVEGMRADGIQQPMTRAEIADALWEGRLSIAEAEVLDPGLVGLREEAGISQEEAQQRRDLSNDELAQDDPGYEYVMTVDGIVEAEVEEDSPWAYEHTYGIPDREEVTEL